MFEDEFSKWVATFEDKMPRNDGDHANAWVPVWEAPKPAQGGGQRADTPKDRGEAPFYGS